MLLATLRTGVLGAALIVAQAPAADAIRGVQVHKAGDHAWRAEAILVVPLPVRDAWAVLTDFDAMAQFVPNLAESRIIHRDGNRLTVLQKGSARFGPIHQSFELIRSVDLVPYQRVHSSNLAGNVRRVESTTTFSATPEGTAVAYQVEMTVDAALPAVVVEAFIRHEIRSQFEAIVREMMRRASVEANPAVRP